MRFPRTPRVLVVALCLSACAPTEPNTGLPMTKMQIGSKTYALEVANTEATRERGLMRRDSMPADHGMIFVFPDAADRAFWMKNTRFNLDILYLGDSGRVVSIKQMKAHDLTGVPSDGPARYAIELNEGQAAAAGVKAGDTLTLPGDLPPAKE
jgi:uncharacterized membrane protein (UPF0127 family)